MVKVKKRDGRIEEFKLSKIVAGCEKAGSSPGQALCIAGELVAAVGERSVVTAEELSSKVITELKKVNEEAAKAFEEYREYRDGQRLAP